MLLCRLSGAQGFERLVALKRVLPSLSQQPGFISMFFDEARLVASIRHPNVVQVFELLEDVTELGIVMEYLEGETLASLRAARGARQERVPVPLALELIAEAAAGVHAAHELRGRDGELLEVIHRDLSPQNIFVTYDGTIKLLDFGVAHARGRVTRTEAGSIKGKIEYMSPEQATGAPLDRRSDVFSLGVVLWELLTGRSLFRRPSMLAVARAVVEEPIVPPSRFVEGLSPRVDEVCLKALARPLADRFQDAAELRRALATVTAEVDASGHSRRDALGALMHATFPDRVAEKQRLVALARSGSAVMVVPEVIPVEFEATPAPLQTVVQPPRRTSRAVVVSLALLALVSVGVASRVVFTRPSATVAPPIVAEPVLPPTVASPVETPPPPPPTAPALPTEVRLRFETEPAGAQVMLGKRALGSTPVEIVVPRSQKSVPVVVKKSGWAPVSSSVVPDGDQKLFLKLTALRTRPTKKPGDPLDEKW